MIEEKKVYKSRAGLYYHLDKMREVTKTTFNWVTCVFPKDTRIVFSKKMDRDRNTYYYAKSRSL